MKGRNVNVTAGGKKLLVYMLLYDDDMLSETLQNNTKLIWQVRSFWAMGYDAWYVMLGKEGIFLCNETTKIRIGKTVRGERGFIHRHYMNTAFLRAMDKYGPFEYAYVRRMVSLPSFVLVLRKLQKQGTKVIVEIPTFSRSAINEDAHSGRWGRVAISPVLDSIEKHYSKYVNLYALIGEHASEINKVPAININNGMNALSVLDLPIRKHEIKENEYHFLVLGHLREYHGIDRIIRGLYEYYMSGEKKKVFIHIVGLDADGCVRRNIELAKTYGLLDHIILDGFCTGEKLDSICNLCDVAFCGLAYYLKGGIVGNELKTREYMSRGIPFVMAVPDETISNQAKYVMHVPNNEEPIDIHEVLAFIDRLRDNNKIAQEMQEYALNHMSWIPELSKVISCVDKTRI